MVKLILLIARKPDMSVEEFQRYWWDTHGPIAARIPGLRHYVQCHTLPELYTRGSQPAYDGAAELWFDDLEALERAMATPEARASQEDWRNFIDQGRVFAITTEEKPVVD
jgi:uncharacterized protein (TIGR02118 family)